jgi:hypothetical protein
MPAQRRRLLEFLARLDSEEKVTTKTIATRLGLPTTTTRRVLEDLNAHGIVRRKEGEDGSDEWWLTRAKRHGYALFPGTRNVGAALPYQPIPRSVRHIGYGCQGQGIVSSRPSATARFTNPDALLTRSDLRELGLERRAVDAIFRALPTVHLPGYARPLVKVADYVALIESSTYRGDRVR